MIQAAWGRSDGGRAAIGYQKDPAAPHLAGHRGEQKVGRFVTAITLLGRPKPIRWLKRAEGNACCGRMRHETFTPCCETIRHKTH